MPILAPGNLTTGLGTHAFARKSQGGITLELSAATQSIATGASTTETLIWNDPAIWDSTGSLWDGGGDSDEFVIPSGWTHIKVMASVFWATDTAGSRRARILINDVADPLYGSNTADVLVSSSPAHSHLVSGIIAVSENDTVKLDVTQDSGGAVDVSLDERTSITILKWNTTRYTHIKLGSAQTITTATATKILFDELVYDGLGIFDADNPAVLDMDQSNAKAAGRRYQCFGGVHFETSILGTLMARFDSATEGTPQTHHMREEYEVNETDSNFGAMICMFTPATGIPSENAPNDGGIGFAVKHEHGSDRDVLNGYLQIEDASDAFNCILTNSANQVVSPSTVESYVQNEVPHTDSSEFQDGTGASYLNVPAHPTGGTWLYAIATACMPWDTTVGNDRLSYIQVDVGAGLVDIEGTVHHRTRQGGMDRLHHAVYFFNSLPVADDEYRGNVWHNEVGNRTMLANEHQHFSLELFD